MVQGNNGIEEMDQRAAIEVAEKYIAHLKKGGFGVQKAYLFGSYAKGHVSEDSDIDLALVFSEISNRFMTQIELMKISRKFDTRIEPHPFGNADFSATNPFVEEILKSGIRLL